jgi:hypothetical protein
MGRIFSVATTAALAAPLAMLAGPASAQYYYGGGHSATCNQIGNSTFCNGSGGTSIQQNRIGNSTFTNIRTPYGNTNCTSNVIGNSVFTNCY